MLGLTAGKFEGGCLITTPDDGSAVTYHDTIQCCHCGRQHILGIEMILRGEMGFCQRCNHPTCPNDYCNRDCVPQERQLEIMEGANPTGVAAGGHFHGSFWLPT